MMVSEAEKRWVVVGIAINKVVAPVLRDVVKQGIDIHYANLNAYCSGLTTPCTLKTLTCHQVSADPILRRLKFQNINNNLDNHGNHISLYNYSVNSSVDLAKLYLHDKHLAEFSAFDESLDMTAILQLLQFNNYHPAAIFSAAIQSSADAVRKDVRNKWGHFDVTEWTEAFFDDCFSKLETLVRSLGLVGGKEKTTLDQLLDWQTKGCQLCMGHAVDKDLLSLVQREVKGIIKDLTLQSAQLFQLQRTAPVLQEQLSSQKAWLDEHDARIGVVEVRLGKEEEARREWNEVILERLGSIEKTLGEELSRWMQGVEESVAVTNTEVKELRQRVGKVEQLKEGLAKTSDRVGQLEHEVKTQMMKGVKPDVSPAKSFDVKSCRSKLAEHYKRTASVPTSVWSKKSPVNIRQIYTRLSWVKEEQTPAGSSQSELTHYTDVLNENENGVVPKRVLVQGQTGIGKSTFVKKLAVDWAELDDGEMTDEQKDVLRRFELAVVIDLKRVSKCHSLRDMINHSHIFADEETTLTEGLLSFIATNQEKVLLVFDGYDEYHCGSNSEIYEIFKGNKLRHCCVLVTTRISKADDLREYKDLHAEITGFSAEEAMAFMSRMLGDTTKARELWIYLFRKNLIDLAKVPLLLLFFCTLWKKGRLQSFPETKTKLYYAIVQYVLDHNQGKHSPAHFGKVQDFKEILAEIGKVALESLLKDDHVFEYDQLSTAILCEESRIIGLLQVTEYAENLRPAGMVSFIHKSIQEFLAAWYITYRCVPERNLGGIDEQAVTLGNCEALENVFQFICGLSGDGAVKLFEHLTSVRISDPELDLSNTIPDIDNEKDLPLSDVTWKQQRFIYLVQNCFQEVNTRTELFTHCLDCTGRIMFVWSERSLPELVPNVNILNQTAVCGVVFLCGITAMRKSLEFLNCLHVPLRITENSVVVSVEEFLRTFGAVECKECFFNCVLHFHNDRAQFYITKLKLSCDDHARLFTETDVDFTPSRSADLCSEQSCFTFLISLSLTKGKRLGTVTRYCKNLKSIQCIQLNSNIFELLEQVPNPSSCRLEFGDALLNVGCLLTSAEAVKLGGVLPLFNLSMLLVDLYDCCAEAVSKLVSSITHKTLEVLGLWNVRLTPASAAALGQSLPEMSSLESLSLTGVDGNTLQVEEVAAIFGGFNKTAAHLKFLTFSNFSVKNCLAPLSERIGFFPNLLRVWLSNLNIDESDLRALLEKLSSVPDLVMLILYGNPLGDKDRVNSIVKGALPQVDLYYQ